MEINLHNYEAYFLDYHENKLDAAATAELMLFLGQHPQLKEEFESYKHVSLEPTAISFGDKDSLRKFNSPVNPNNFDEIAAQAVDGTLSLELQHELEKFTGLNPNYAKELELYNKTRLTPDLAVIFDNKEDLKRSTRVVRPTALYWSAAAAVILLVSAYFLFRPPVKINDVVTHNNIAPIVDTSHKTATTVQQMPMVKQSPIPMANIAHHKQTLHRYAKPEYVQQLPKKEQELSPAPKQDTTRVIVSQEPKKVLQSTCDTARKKIVVNNDSDKHKGDTAFRVINNINSTIAWNNNSVKHKELNRVLYAVGNPFRSIGKFFKHGISVRKCYNKGTGKLIAYRLEIGTANHNFFVKNSY